MGQNDKGLLARLFGQSEQQAAVAEQDSALLELETARIRAETKLLEATTSYTGQFVDPDDALRGDKGEMWTRIGGETETHLSAILNTEPELKEARNTCRALATVNEYALNGHENRISYVVGTGHVYRVMAKPGTELAEQITAEQEAEEPEDLLADAQEVIDTFLRDTKWHKRQAEIVLRKDRDGECFLRFFRQTDGRIDVRFVEPGQVATPESESNNPAVKFGIETDEKDVETVKAYWIDGESVNADQVQHRKENVDANVRRGVPLFYPVRKLLQKIETLQNNMALLAGIQSAIAMIRKHGSGSKVPIERQVQGDADVEVLNTRLGTTSYFRRYPGGKILDASDKVQYEFPADKARPDAYVAVCAFLLRAVAARIQMPEFMLTSDASNANYASTMVAEGPAVKKFERLQCDMVEDDREVMNRVLDAAVEAKRLDADVRADIEIDVTLPTLTTRDRLKEVQADEILVRNEAMSVGTMAERHGLDPDAEQEKIDKARADKDLYGGDEEFPPKEPREQPEEGEEDS